MDGKLFIEKCNEGEYHCQQCYDYHGYDFEKDGWDEQEIDQIRTHYYREEQVCLD